MPRVEVSLESRAARHAALGDPVRLAIVDELAVSDLAPVELQERFGLASNLLAHHLDVAVPRRPVERRSTQLAARVRRPSNLEHEPDRRGVVAPRGIRQLAAIGVGQRTHQVGLTRMGQSIENRFARWRN